MAPDRTIPIRGTAHTGTFPRGMNPCYGPLRASQSGQGSGKEPLSTMYDLTTPELPSGPMSFEQIHDRLSIDVKDQSSYEDLEDHIKGWKPRGW